MKAIGVSSTKRFPEGEKFRFVFEESNKWQDYLTSLKISLIENPQSNEAVCSTIYRTLNFLMNNIMYGVNLVGRNEFEETYKLHWS